MTNDIIKTLADAAQHYKDQLDAGTISQPEFKELVEDLNIKATIDKIADELDTSEKEYAALMAIVQLAGIIY